MQKKKRLRSAEAAGSCSAAGGYRSVIRRTPNPTRGQVSAAADRGRPPQPRGEGQARSVASTSRRAAPTARRAARPVRSEVNNSQ